MDTENRGKNSTVCIECRDTQLPSSPGLQKAATQATCLGGDSKIISQQHRLTKRKDILKLIVGNLLSEQPSPECLGLNPTQDKETPVNLLVPHH